MNKPKSSLCLRWDGFRLPKQGNAWTECEDALGGRLANGRFAIADGASESGFAGVWSSLLVECFLREAKPWSQLLATARPSWLETVKPQAVTWHAETKFEEGAFAAFLGLRIGKSKSRTGRYGWSARARGDSCLFQVRDCALVTSFPLKRSSQFNDRPPLLGSRSLPQNRDKMRQQRGTCQPDDRFFLMTDAIARWFLTECERCQRPWEQLNDIENPDDFFSWVCDQRATEKLRNDDVALLRIRTFAR